jgi:hypothetical protein
MFATVELETVDRTRFRYGVEIHRATFAVDGFTRTDTGVMLTFGHEKMFVVPSYPRTKLRIDDYDGNVLFAH